MVALGFIYLYMYIFFFERREQKFFKTIENTRYIAKKIRLLIYENERLPVRV